MVETLPDPLTAYWFQRAGSAPPPEYGWLRPERPAARVTLANGNTAWLLTRHEDVRTALAHPKLSTWHQFSVFGSAREERYMSPGHFIHMDSPDHEVIRRMLTAHFTAKRIEGMRPVVQRLVDELIDDMLSGPRPADLTEAFAFRLSTTVIYEMLGIPREDWEFLLSRALIGSLRDDADRPKQQRPPTVSDTTKEQEKREYLHRLIGQKDEQPGDDIISDLVVKRMRTGELTQNDIVGISSLLIGAGSDTTANQIGLGILTLLEHPDELARLRADPELVPQAVEELLRYLSIVELSPASRRVALEDVEIGGQLIRKGEGVLPSIMAGNRDGAQFPDPDVLDIDRETRNHLAFSHGIHYCLGAPLARLELQVAFTSLTQRIPGLRLAVPADEVPLRHKMMVFGVERLPVTW